MAGFFLDSGGSRDCCCRSNASKLCGCGSTMEQFMSLISIKCKPVLQSQHPESYTGPKNHIRSFLLCMGAEYLNSLHWTSDLPYSPVFLTSPSNLSPGTTTLILRRSRRCSPMAAFKLPPRWGQLLEAGMSGGKQSSGGVQIPAWYSVSWITVIFLNWNKMVGTGICAPC